jgi:hypothetical protein
MVARRLRSSFSASTLTRLRQMPACDALALLATHVKADPTFLPVKDDQSQRWHLCTRRGDFEIVTTGGAIDLAIHLLDVTFVEAVKLLNRKGAPHGADHPQGLAADPR